jgi:hypothetical protein
MSNLILGLSTSYEDASTKPSSIVDVRLASRPFRDGDQQWLPRIVAGSDPEIRLAVSMPWDSGPPAASYGAIDIANPDGALDAWMEGIWTGRAGELKVGYANLPWDQWWPVAVLRMNAPEYIDGRILRLTFRDRIKDLSRPIQKNFFEAAPNTELNGQRKPMLIGKPWQVPALLWDEVSTTEIYYYVADNAEPLRDDFILREGLAVIGKGTAAGEYQDWPNGFQLNSQPTLPVTCFFRGPAFEPWPLPSSRFTEWATVDGLEVPVDWPELENEVIGSRYIQRRPDTDLLEVVVNNVPSGWVRIGQGTPLEADTTYRLHWRAVDDPAIDNELKLEIRAFTAATGNTSNWQLFQGDVDFLNDHAIEFTTPAAINDYFIRLRFDRIVLPGNTTALFEAIWLEQVDDSAETVDQLVPYLLCERGVLTGVEESGPFGYTEIDHADLIAVRDGLTARLGHYWQDESTHRDLLDLLFRSMDACWWISRQGKFKARRAFLSAEAAVLTFDDSNRTTSIEIARASAENLSDSFLMTRNFRPVREGEAADTVNEGEKAAGSRDYRRQERASVAARTGLHPDYEFAIGAAADETAITTVTGTANQDRANDRLLEHGQRIWLWRVEAILTVEQQALLEPMTKIELVSSRLGLAEGIAVEIVDIRLLPVSGRVQIIARG